MLRDAGGLYLINGNPEYKVDSKPFFKSHLSFQNCCENFMRTLKSDEKTSSKGQTISKANYGVLNSPKKGM